MPRRHLVIVHQPGWQQLEDWYDITSRVLKHGADIKVFVVNNEQETPVLRDRAAAEPTLVLSAGPLGRFRPARGRVYAGRRVAKVEQLERLGAAGLPVPRWRLFEPDAVFDAAEWGAHVVVKPADGLSSTGVGIRHHRSAAVDGSPVRGLSPAVEHSTGRMIVQELIDTGPTLNYYRVLTFFGRPLYCMRERLREPLPMDADGVPVAEASITNQGYTRAQRIFDFVDDADALALARACHDVLPDCPLKGVDLLRCARTGKLFVLELNPGGNTWHFSSDHSRKRGIDPAFEAAKRDHFDAFQVAADTLVERTLAEAV